MKSLRADQSRQQAGPVVLGIDPGTDKCGVAVLAADRAVLYRDVLSLQALPTTIAVLLERFQISQIAIGGGTGSALVETQLAQAHLNLPVTRITEEMTSLLARRRYWQDHPPRGLARLIPLGLRVPPRPVDDYAAVIIAERLLAAKTQEQ